MPLKATIPVCPALSVTPGCPEALIVKEYVESELIILYERFELGAVIVELVAREETLIVPYCADAATILVAVDEPDVFDIVNAPAVKFALVNEVIPAIEISKYSVSPLLVILPHKPDSVPVVIIGKESNVVPVNAMSYPVGKSVH